MRRINALANVTAGGIMRGVYAALLLKAGIVAEFVFASLNAQSSELDSLRNERNRIQEILQIVQDGRPPCSSSECQSKKAELFYDLQTQLMRTPPIETRLPEIRSQALLAAQQLIRIKKTRELRSPKNLADWVDWYQNRAQYDLEYEARWHFYSEELTFVRNSIRYFLSRIQNPAYAHDFENAWSLGMGEAAYAILESRDLAQLKVGLNESSSKFRQIDEEIKRLNSKVQRIQDQLPDRMGVLFAKFLPGIPPENHLNFFRFFYSSCEYNYCSGVLDSDFQNFLKEYLDQTKLIADDLRDFDELEFGVIGLNNLQSSSNPSELAAHEIKIQKKLESVEGVLRFGLGTTAEILEFSILQSVLGGSRILGGLALGGVHYLEVKWDMPFAETLLPKSDRIKKLEDLQKQFDIAAAARMRALQSFQADAQIKLNQINTRIKELEELQ